MIDNVPQLNLTRKVVFLRNISVYFCCVITAIVDCCLQCIALHYYLQSTHCLSHPLIDST